VALYLGELDFLFPFGFRIAGIAGIAGLLGGISRQTPSLPDSEPRFNVPLKKQIPIRNSYQNKFLSESASITSSSIGSPASLHSFTKRAMSEIRDRSLRLSPTKIADFLNLGMRASLSLRVVTVF
jgi:hypothetical protein